MKIRLVGAEYSQADGRTDRQTDMTKLTGAFCNFADAPDKWWKQKAIKMGWEKRVEMTVQIRSQFLKLKKKNHVQ